MIARQGPASFHVTESRLRGLAICSAVNFHLDPWPQGRQRRCAPSRP